MHSLLPFKCHRVKPEDLTEERVVVVDMEGIEEVTIGIVDNVFLILAMIPGQSL